MVKISEDKIINFINSNFKEYISFLNDFEDVIYRLNPKLEYKIDMNIRKPYIDWCIKALDIKGSVSYHQINQMKTNMNCSTKDAIINYLEDAIIK